MYTKSINYVMYYNCYKKSDLEILTQNNTLFAMDGSENIKIATAIATKNFGIKMSLQ